MEIKVLCRGSEAGHSASDLFCSLQEKKPKVFLVYRGPTGSVPWTAVGFVFSGAFEAINEGGSDEHLMLGNGLKYLRSIKIEVNWFPYLQTLLPKFHDVEELGPPECWAVVVVVLECWCCRGLVCAEVHRDQWIKKIPSWLLIITSFRWLMIWAAMGDFLVFSALPHPLRHFLRHWPQLVPPQIVSLVTEFAVDRWTTRRGPLGWCGGPALFHIFWAAVDRIFWNRNVTMSVG
uniref:Uncharacterized protein n=1 Tax=Fagus sylvatica TaxID=28930 RepID=A0A2N9HPS8_FAGSY